MRMRTLAVSLLLMAFVVKAWAYIDPDYQSGTTSTTTTQSTGLDQMIQQKTTDAEKVFQGVTYENMAGQDKAGFFAGGGMTGADTAGSIHSFRIPGSN